MPRKPAQKPENQDPILQVFEETKGEQLDLLEGFVPLEGAETSSAPLEKKIIVREDGEHDDRRITMQESPAQEDAPQEPTKWYQGYEGEEYTEEEWNSPVMRGGPTRREVEGWKERYGGFVYFTPFENDVFVWRTLQRPEYREIIRDQTLMALDREEHFTERCVLYPYDFSIEKIKKSRAGIASLLSEMIMDKSGFVAQSAPIKL